MVVLAGAYLTLSPARLLREAPGTSELELTPALAIDGGVPQPPAYP
jgi:hypothetical protein